MPRYELALILKVMERVDFYSNIIIWYHIIHENNTHILHKLGSVNDLGVIFDSNLSFIDHISHKINKAYNITYQVTYQVRPHLLQGTNEAIRLSGPTSP